MAADRKEDTINVASRALAVLFEDGYPCSKKVQQSLGEIYLKSGGTPDDFKEKFLRPTLTLLEKLKMEGFPLVKDGKIIVHLAAPSECLELGEMFFQVGHATPGTLSSKFTRPCGQSVILQPSYIPENEYHQAFTPEYIQQLKNEAGLHGNKIMRKLVVSVSNGQEYSCERIDIYGIMSPLIGNRDSQSSCQAVDPSFSSTLCCTPEENSDRQPVEQSTEPIPCSSATANPLPCGRIMPYPPTYQAEPDQPQVEGTGQESDQYQPHSSSDRNDPQYPPIQETAGDKSQVGDTSQQQDQHQPYLSSDRKNPQYPHIHEAVRDKSQVEDTSQQPSQHQPYINSDRNSP